VLAARLADRRGELTLDVELSAAAGTTTVLVGESGAGKTSILRALAGLDRPARGRITVDGVDWLDSERDLSLPPWRRAVGYVPQDYALFPHLTVERNVAFGLEGHGLAPGERRRRVQGALAIAGVTALAHRLPERLSGGEQQRVALARAFVVKPAVLLADEPTGSLDFATGETVMELMFDLNREQGTTLVLVTHDTAIARRCEHRITIEAGRVAG
jgi:putative ABC transport system ATP-binding protein